MVDTPFMREFGVREEDTVKRVKFEINPAQPVNTEVKLTLPANDLTISPASSVFQDDEFTIQDNLDQTKQLKFETGGISSGNTRTLISPNLNGTIALTSQLPDIEQADFVPTFSNNSRLTANPTVVKAYYKRIEEEVECTVQLTIPYDGTAAPAIWDTQMTLPFAFSSTQTVNKLVCHGTFNSGTAGGIVNGVIPNGQPFFALNGVFMSVSANAGNYDAFFTVKYFRTVS